MILSYETEVSREVGVDAATVLYFMQKQKTLTNQGFLYEYLPYDGEQIDDLLKILIEHGYVERDEPEGGTGVHGYTVRYRTLHQ